MYPLKSNKKWVWRYREDNISLGSIKIVDYFKSKDDSKDLVDLPINKSAWSAKKLLVPT